MGTYYLKLHDSEVAAFIAGKLITFEQADQIFVRSLQREPGERDSSPVKFWLNKPETIWVQSIEFYGGENFGEPYCFLAEICHCTTESAFSRFLHKHNIPQRIFSY